ncbi:MFS transporter [Nocardioides sp. cx-173]|uniref:MFS transporter n=1 Tax=Nocardioides sp. cx-173 TaxID=2898796 RepID=UPI001E3700FE|nr:MFS transporter [Nocardioides sp. cx-173]MCD4526290.1 MFS transporter [Nocardioides sp. cx-173]UGB43466.1 MFS transporter [Nocardioides sp. cx-173]
MTAATSTPREQTPATRRRWAGLAVLSASLLVVVMDMTVLNLALPDMSADLRPGPVELLWIVDVYPLVLAGLLVAAGSLGDRWGRRRMLVGGFTVFGLASLVVLVADTAGEVIAVRALLGVGGAMIMPSTLSLIRTLFSDPRERATALGVWGSVAAVGSALGPIVGGALLERFSWHSAFLFNVPVMVVAVVAALVLLPESRSARPGRLDVATLVLSMLGMVALVHAIKQLGKDGPDTEAVVATVVAVVALTLFVRRCLAAAEPMLELRLFRGRAFSAGMLTALVSSFAMAGLLLLVAQWLQLSQAYEPFDAGVALLPMAAGGILAGPFAPALAARIGARTVLAGGLVVGSAGLLLLAVLPQPLAYPGVAVALSLVGLGLASLAVASAVIMAGAPLDQAGSAAVLEESSYEIGAVLGVAILGSIATTAGLGAATLSEALARVGLAGGLAMLAIAGLVALLAPRELDLAAVEH